MGVSVTRVDNGYGDLVPVDLSATLAVKRRVYFGYLPIARIRGLKDEHTGAVVTNAFTTGELDPIEVENQWKRLEPDEEPPVRPVIEVIGLDCYKVAQK
jgi:hypothetical protein